MLLISLDLNSSALLPLLGVALGWLLSQFGVLISDRRERRKVFGQAMLRFLELYEAAQSKRRAFILAQAYAKRGESERAMSFRQHKLEGLNESLAGLTKVTNDISTIDPFLAFDLQRRISGLSLVLEGIMSGIEGNDAVLQELEQAMRVSFATELETCIVKVAWRKGVVSSLKALWHLRKEKYRAEHESSNADQVVSLMQMLKTAQRVGGKGKAEDAID